jgi:hypothetical protein
MASRRNTITALLFLAGLITAVVFLILGVLPQEEQFRPAQRPSLSQDRVRLLHRTEEASDPAPVQALPHALLNKNVVSPLPSYQEVDGAVSQLIDGADEDLNDLLDRDHTFIQLYGGAQRLLGRQVMEDADPQYTVVKLTEDVLTFASLEAEQLDMTERAEEMVDFAQRVKKEFKTPLLYVQAPSKLDMVSLPDGITDYADAEADQFLSILQDAGVDTLDLRPTFRAAAAEDPEAVETYFFHTDHHWTPAGAFLGYQALCERLEEDYRFDIDEELTDPDSFRKYTFEDVFLGSQGRRVGTLYAGLDDLEIWSPKFATDFTYSVPMSGIQREGPFAVSLLFPERLADTGYYDTNAYTIYAGDDYLLARSVNLNNPDGKRILILRDSFGCALTPFLSLACQEVIAIDPRNFNGDQDSMMDYIDWLEPDLVIVMNTTGSLRTDQLYPYLPSARQAYLEAKEASRAG